MESILIGASRSEPLPGGADGDFVYIYVYICVYIYMYGTYGLVAF